MKNKLSRAVLVANVKKKCRMVNSDKNVDQADDIFQSRGPHGYGHPDDRRLRKVEIEGLIAKQMKAKAQKLCSDEVKAFHDCTKENGLSMVWYCRHQSAKMGECCNKLYADPKFRDEVTEEYLEKRRQFRITGIKESQKKKESVTF